MHTDTNSRFDRLDQFIAENRILRFCWSDIDEAGRERACLLVALAPEVGQGDFDACPASVIPPWLARLTPLLDDGVSDDLWPELMLEYARVVRRGATTLDDARWRRVQVRFILAVLADTFSSEDKVVASLWRRVLAGDEPSSDEWATAVSTSWGAARESAKAAAWGTRDMAAVEVSAWGACWDRMARALFAAIETECGEQHKPEGDGL